MFTSSRLVRLYLVVFAVLTSPLVWGQVSNSTARHIIYSSTLPANCNPNTGDVYFKTTATVGVYQCATANTWTYIGSGGGGSGTPAAYTTVTPSATPTFTVTSNTVELLKLTVAANVTSSTLSVGSVKTRVILDICENATGGFTVVMPTNVLNMGAIDTNAHHCTTGDGSWDGTNLIIESTTVHMDDGTALTGAVQLCGRTSGCFTLTVPDVAGTDHVVKWPTTNGTTNYVLSTDGGSPATLAWVAQSGGGGPVVRISDYAGFSNPPCTLGDIYYLTSGIFPFIVCTGTNNWQPFMDGHPVNPAANLSLATLGTAPAPGSVNSSQGYEVMTMPGGGSVAYSLRYTSAAVPGSTPYTKYIVLRAFSEVAAGNNRIWFVGFMDSTGKSYGMECGIGAVASGFWCDTSELDNTGSRGGTIDGPFQLSMLSGLSLNTVVALTNDGTNISVAISTNGTDFVNMGTQTIASYFTTSPTRFTYGVLANVAGVVKHTFVGVY